MYYVMESYMMDILRLDKSDPSYENEKEAIERIIENISQEHQRRHNRRELVEERNNDEMEQRRQDICAMELRYGY